MADGSAPAVNAIKRRLDTLKSERGPHERVWRDCFDMSYPLRGSGLQQAELSAQQGMQKRAELQDGTSTDACATTASGIVSGMTPSNSIWIGYGVNDETEEETRFFDGAATFVWENIHGSNFDSIAHENALDWLIAGWFVTYIDLDRERGGYVFEQWALCDCYLASTRTDGKVDTILREFTLTAEQAVKEYGEDMVSEGTKKLASTAPYTLVKLVQVIEPRKPAMAGARMAKNLPFSSCHYETDNGNKLRESGYHEFPCVVPRWQRLPKSVYAVGKMFDALPDVRELNHIKFLELANLELALAGMYVAVDDGVLNTRNIKIGARKVIVAADTDSFKPISSGVDFNIAFTKEEKLQASIRRTLMADTLPPMDAGVRTAAEIHARINLIRQQLGPIYGRGQAEYLQPMAERCFGLALRAGALGNPPRSLQGKELKIKYVSPLARAQKLEEVSAIEHLYTSAGMISQAKQNTEAFDFIDDAAAMGHLSKGLSVPANVMRKTDDVVALRKDRAAQEQAAKDDAQQQQAMAGAGAVASKALAAK